MRTTVDLSTHAVALASTARKVNATRRRCTLTDDATLTFEHDPWPEGSRCTTIGRRSGDAGAEMQ